VTRRQNSEPFGACSSSAALSRVLGVQPGDIDYVLSRIDSFYVRDERPKPNGGTRVLHKPQGRLIKIQAQIKRAILDKVPPLPFVHGGIRRRSIVTNAAPHVGREVVLALDIKDCFPSIGPHKVLSVFNELGMTGQAALILVRLTTFDFQLPQGTKTSPALANLVLRSIDRRLHALAEHHCCFYTRYVDDIVLSGARRLVKLQGLVHKILSTEGFKPKVKKEVMFQSEPQVVTKLLVNQKVNVTKDRRDAIRREVFDQLAEGQTKMPASTIGKARWLESINPEVGSKLVARISSQPSRPTDDSGSSAS
jgi:RNA-directed DNA polymerase